MSIYKFPTPSQVPEVIFRHANDRPPVALLTAADTLTPDQVSTIRRAMDSGGWSCVPATVNGKDILQVSGFGKEEQLLSFMHGFNFVEGKAAYTPEPGDHPKLSTNEWLQDNSQKLAGVFNTIGDVSLLISGLVKGDGKEALSGALYTAGGGILATHGNVKTEHHLTHVAEETARFLKGQAGKLPEDCGLFTIMKEKREGIVPSIDKFLTRYPTQTMVGIYTMGALTMLQSGIKNRDPWGIAYGVNSTLAGAASILIPEKKNYTEKKHTPSHSPIGRLFDWIQEKPLRMVGYAYILSDIALGMSAMREYKNNPKNKGYIFKFISAGTFTVASLMLAISNKDHVNADGKFDTDEQRRIEALVAEAVSRQPKEMQAALINNTAGFLTTQPEMKGNATDIAKAITAQLEHLQRNPWVLRAQAPEQPLNKR